MNSYVIGSRCIYVSMVATVCVGCFCCCCFVCMCVGGGGGHG